MTTEKKDCPHTDVGKDSVCKECGKRIIKAHKGGRGKRISQRAMEDVIEMFDEMADQYRKQHPGSSKADYLDNLIRTTYKKFKEK